MKGSGAQPEKYFEAAPLFQIEESAIIFKSCHSKFFILCSWVISQNTDFLQCTWNIY